MIKKYRDYFAIDPEYFPAVDEKLIDQGKVDWKKFYPHATFVSLLKNVVRVLERKDKLSLWVEGSYGTGKSHAVLTLKKLLDAPVAELSEYFDRYNLDKDLLNKFKGLKESDGEILTVHRYGSSSIYGDRDVHNQQIAGVVVQIHRLRLGDLGEIGRAGDPSCRPPCLIQGGKKKARKNCNDRNYDKQFYQSEVFRFFRFMIPPCFSKWRTLFCAPMLRIL